MTERRDRSTIKGLAVLSLIITAIAVGVFFFFGSSSQKPTGWGAAYAFGTPVTVQLPSSCSIETIVGRGGGGSRSGKCEGSTWTADGKPVTGTLYAKADDLPRSDGGRSFTGEARALGDRAYGEPETADTLLHLSLMGAAALGLLGLLGCGIAAILPARRSG
ncbi:hypothetical protein NLX86_20760 [Streptomyces sp. A3M-1-3]|uniref:hypothetical protein n=1 Tax=Streptomyces sp. A3M-1-3 TaxID=2962044 RepID=UPI0020B6F630|nr:hypothetical protein [Streptomyces sp. A3M-1-3]MCP3820437.1 hypothetical protein [Streptomyces sp. A3M-1-3]